MLKWLKGKLSKKPQPLRSTAEVEENERALELVALGDKMFTTEDYQGAIDAYDSALGIDGHCAEAWYRRGRYFMREEKILEAAACYVRTVELKPQKADAWCGLGDAILAYLKADQEQLFIREHRAEILSEAQDCFNRAIKLGSDFPRAKEGRQECGALLKENSFKLAKPPIFSFHSGGILETAKRDVVSPFLKPGDYRRKTLQSNQND